MGELVLVGIIALLMYHLGARNVGCTSNQRIAELEAQIKSLKASMRKAKTAQGKPMPASIDNTSGAKFMPYIPPKGKVS